MKKILLIVLLLSGILISEDMFAQSGGRRKEHRNQRRSSKMFGGGQSRGNANKFAKGAGRQGIIARLFKKNRAPAWVMHHKGSLRDSRRENRFLFNRYRTKGKRYREGILAKQNADRARKRVRGNAVFAKRKY